MRPIRCAWHGIYFVSMQTGKLAIVCRFGRFFDSLKGSIFIFCVFIPKKHIHHISFTAQIWTNLFNFISFNALLLFYVHQNIILKFAISQTTHTHASPISEQFSMIVSVSSLPKVSHVIRNGIYYDITLSFSQTFWN